MLLYTISFIFICLIYEAGRITTAEILNMKPAKIIFGFGKTLYQKKIKNIEYLMSVIPIGWRVVFNVKNKFTNVVLSFGGLLFTVLITLITGFLLSFFNNTGFIATLEIEEPKGIIEKAGIKANDQIIKINDIPARTINDVKIIFNDNYNDIICKKTILTVLRDKDELIFDVSAKFNDGSYFDCENNKKKVDNFLRTLKKEEQKDYIWLLAITPKVQGTKYSFEHSFLFTARMFGTIFGEYFLNYVPKQDNVINEYSASNNKNNPVQNINFPFIFYCCLIIANCFFIFISIFLPFPPAFMGNIVAWAISAFKNRKTADNN